MRILFAAPAWWPAAAFGGPVVAARELTSRLVARGHSVEVLTTSLESLDRPGSWHSRVEEQDGVRVHYLATPARYRWMGITPTLPVELERAERPDVVHVFGFRDPVTTMGAAWARLRGVPYVFEPLGMFRARLRKVALKRALDSTLYRGVASGAGAVVAASSIERDDVAAAGVVPQDRIHVRGNGFPEPFETPAANRAELGIPDDVPIVLYVGRIAAGKGIEHLVAALLELPQAHLVLVGPDDRHGVAEGLGGERVHVVGPTDGPPLALYGQIRLSSWPGKSLRACAPRLSLRLRAAATIISPTSAGSETGAFSVTSGCSAAAASSRLARSRITPAARVRIGRT